MQSFLKNMKSCASPSGLIKDPVLEAEYSGSDSASSWSAVWTQGSRWSLSFEKKFCSKTMRAHQWEEWDLFTLMAGSPSFRCKKVGMCTGNFWDFSMLYCTLGSMMTSSCSLWEWGLSRFSQIMLIRRCCHSILESCCGIDWPLVRRNCPFEVLCSHSLWSTSC